MSCLSLLVIAFLNYSFVQMVKKHTPKSLYLTYQLGRLHTYMRIPHRRWSWGRAFLQWIEHRKAPRGQRTQGQGAWDLSRLHHQMAIVSARLCLPIMQSSHFPVRLASDIFSPSTNPLFAISWIVSGLQCAKRWCHCSREVDCIKDSIARVMLGVGSVVSKRYILLMFLTS